VPVTFGADMNYLGHLYLSGSDPLVVLGNFMGDAIKGRDLSRFPGRVEQGIRLHRAIDSFTDQHPSLSAGRERVRAHAGRYAGVVMDLFYDHLLASQWQRWHATELPDFAAAMYEVLAAQEAHMPAETRFLFGHMRSGDWLSNYATLEGVGRSLHGLSRRAPHGAAMSGAERVLADNLEAYRAEFDIFLPAITVHTSAWR
jgi:acyl carrier protein phosphodiesterase